MKSSILALAVFFFLFALLASTSSLAARDEPSLLHTNGNNDYFVSKLRGVVQDGLNLVLSASDECPNRSSWPELVGINGVVAVAIIKKTNPCLNVYLCPINEFSGPCNSADYRTDRVRVLVNVLRKVIAVPRIG